MTKSLAYRLYMKQHLYSFKIREDKNLDDQIDEFINILEDLENLEVKLEEGDKALILLNALPKTFEIFKDVTLYGRDSTITLEEVQAAINAKELQRKLQNEENHGE